MDSVHRIEEFNAFEFVRDRFLVEGVGKVQKIESDTFYTTLVGLEPTISGSGDQRLYPLGHRAACN